MSTMMAIILFFHLAIAANNEVLGRTQKVNRLHERTVAVTQSALPKVFPRASLHVLDEQGIVIGRVTTNQIIRLRIQGNAYMDFKPMPLVSRCWYQELSTNYLDHTNNKSKMFLEKGCAVPNSLLKMPDAPFFKNGDLEAYSPPIEFTSGHDKTMLNRLVITCNTIFCNANQICDIKCPNKWSNSYNVAKHAYSVNASTTVDLDFVDLKAVVDTKTVKLATALKVGDKQDKNPESRKVISDENTFLKKYLEYFVLAILLEAALLLICCTCVGYKHFAVNNRLTISLKDTVDNNFIKATHVCLPTKSSMTHSPMSKVTHVHDADGACYDVIPAYKRVSSPPPEYGHSVALAERTEFRYRDHDRNHCPTSDYSKHSVRRHADSRRLSARSQ